jgi:endoglucanase
VLAASLGASCAAGLLPSPLLAAARGRANEKFRLGINLAGAEFEAIGGRWEWPKMDNLAYYLGKGFTIFRIPFRWDRLQPELRGPLKEEALKGLDALIMAINAKNAIAVLDAHDYGRRQKAIIGAKGSPVTSADFADFWGRMARRYRARPLVWYNLMNEPHDMPAEANLAAQNAACKAIRDAGARAMVLFSGVAWTGAHSWIGSGNGKVMLGARDPANNYAFDVHQYLDPGFGGSNKQAVPGVGSHILNGVTNWARTHRKKLFLGEFGGGPGKGFIKEMDALLAHMVANRDVFLGATYFGGGGVWGGNSGSSDPIRGVDQPQTLLMERYLKRL